MKIIYLGALSTGLVVILGMVAVLPAFTQQNAPPQLDAMLVFEVNKAAADNLPYWCTGLAETLKKYDVRATIFMPGSVADSYPRCVVEFAADDRIDIGSQTYSYVNLASIPDYTRALDEVKSGKHAIDRAGRLDSQLFRAPSGTVVDPDIYSLLSRSGIFADFSYSTHYNKFLDGQFIRYKIQSFDGTQYPPEHFFALKEISDPIIISFDNSVPIKQIDAFLAGITAGKPEDYKLRFANASDVARMPLTIRKGAL
ncbi:polysaccharide deacetylase family protein [Nitrososphaera sp.]|uniref:polysaccharide deacetylase family protein n=1 Tax=Nitrososphaera sp. TaxID=1971748 RepID=UPI00307D4A48